MTHVVYTNLSTFAGPLCIAETARGVCHVGFGDHGKAQYDKWEYQPERTSDATEQLSQYFSGVRTFFDLPLDVEGSEFQQRVWRELQTIPYGQTTSYGALARRLGKPGASRAVGSANGKNALAIVVPCHRVIAAGGGLGGFAWGLPIKARLLEWEQRSPG